MDNFTNFCLFGIFLSGLLVINVRGQAQDLYCYACGRPEADPEIDEPGSFGDSRRPGISEDKKMYNLTCDIAEAMGGLDARWLRKCPFATKSCFWSEATLDEEMAIFRGCAPSVYPFIEGCYAELESVPTGTGSLRVAPRITTCYCNSNNCNTVLAVNFPANGAISNQNNFNNNFNVALSLYFTIFTYILVR